MEPMVKNAELADCDFDDVAIANAIQADLTSIQHPPQHATSPASESEINALRREIRSLREAVSILDAKNKEKANRIAAETQRSHCLQADLDRMVMEVSRLSQSNDELGRVLRDAIQQKKDATPDPRDAERIRSMEKQIYRLNKGKEHLERQVQELVSDLDHWKMEAERGRRAQSEMDGLLQARDGYRHTSDERAHELRELKLEIEQLRRFDVGVGDVPAQLQRTSQALTAKDTELRERMSRVEELEAENTALKTENAGLEERLRSLAEKMVEKESTSMSSVALVAELEEKFKSLNAELEARKVEIARLMRTKVKYEAHSAEAEKVYNELRDIAETERKRLAAVCAQLAEETQAHQAALQLIASLQEQIHYLENHGAGASPQSEESIAALMSELEALRSSNEALSEQLRDSRLAEASLTERVGDLLMRRDPTQKGEKKSRLKQAAQVELQLRAALTGKQGEIENLTEALRKKESDVEAVQRECEALLARNMELQLRIATSGS